MMVSRLVGGCAVPLASGEKIDFVKKEIREGIRTDGNSQAQGHPISPAKVLAHYHQGKRQGSQQKSCANNSHCSFCVLIRPNRPKCYSNRENAEPPGLAPLPSIRFLPRQQVVSLGHVQTAWRPSGRRGPRAHDRRVTPGLPGSVAPGDPESGAASFCAAAEHRKRGRNLRAAIILSLPASAPA